MMEEGLTFDDVLIVPSKSIVSSRKDISLSTQLTRKISLNIPLVGANMDSVTESKMGIALAREGGIGIIHRFLPIEQEVIEVNKVKRSEGILIESPYTLSINSNVMEAKKIMGQHGVKGLLIVDEGKKLSGILTSRDILFEDDDTFVKDVMTKDVVAASPNVSQEEAKEILHKHRIEKLPLIDENKLVKGLVTMKDILKREKHPLAIKDEKGRLRVGAAIGVKDDFVDRARALLDAEADVLVLDIAHGHADHAIEAIKTLKRELGDFQLIAGNVATGEGTADLIAAGADAIKVGVGPGAFCTTRIVTGAGVPQLTAILNCIKIAEQEGIPLIADGGIRTSGDLTKALAAGASSAMLGNLLVGTEESPGVTILRSGKKYKLGRGMASFSATMGRQERHGEEKDVSDMVPEGVEAMALYKGSAIDIIQQLIGGLRSGISYAGSNNVDGLRKNTKFIKMSEKGLSESHPHDVNILK